MPVFVQSFMMISKMVSDLLSGHDFQYLKENIYVKIVGGVMVLFLSTLFKDL